jgi:hypothetical protein
VRRGCSTLQAAGSCAFLCISRHSFPCLSGTSGADGEGELRVSGIRAKLAREEDLLGNVTPYLVRDDSLWIVCGASVCGGQSVDSLWDVSLGMLVNILKSATQPASDDCMQPASGSYIVVS